MALENCHAFFQWSLPTTSVITTVFFVLPFVLGEVFFHEKIDFKGSAHNYTLPRIEESECCCPKEKVNMCINLDSTEPLSSLNTSKCLFVYDHEDCRSNFYREDDLLSVKIPPGEYADLSKFLHDRQFPCPVKSFQSCEEEIGIGQKPDVTLKRDFLSGFPYIIEMRDVCGCMNIPETMHDRVRVLLENKHCISLYSDPDCKGKSVQVQGGFNGAARDLRRVGFKGLAKSLNLCEDVPACHKNNNEVNGWIVPNDGQRHSFLSKYESNLPRSTWVKYPAPIEMACMNSGRSEETLSNYSCSTDCGGVLLTESGAIHYKVGESLEPFERCVWIVRAPSTRSRFIVNFIWRGFEPIISKAEVVVSGFVSLGSSKMHHLEKQSVDETTKQLEVPGPLMVITLYTEELLETLKGREGFILEYNTVLVDSDIVDERLMTKLSSESVEDRPMSPLSSDYRISFGDSVRYPPAPLSSLNTTSPYSENELSTFLFLPTRADLESGWKRYEVRVIQAMKDLGTSCCDFIYIMKFIPYPGIWSSFFWSYPMYNTIRNETSPFFYYGDKQIITKDMIFLVYRSSTGTAPGKGFALSSEVQGDNVCYE